MELRERIEREARILSSPNCARSLQQTKLYANRVAKMAGRLSRICRESDKLPVREIYDTETGEAEVVFGQTTMQAMRNAR